ncbi:MAG: hypothetical protein R3305_00535, partial [Gammaproteobacteria bacterium]|nr:hypothetical protein [Gammaproteobacteria bacterium]
MIRTTTNSIGILAAALATSSLAQEPVPLEELGLIVDIDRPPDQVIPLWPGTPPGGQNVDFEQFEETLTNPFDLPDQAI